MLYQNSISYVLGMVYAFLIAMYVICPVVVLITVTFYVFTTTVDVYNHTMCEIYLIVSMRIHTIYTTYPVVIVCLLFPIYVCMTADLNMGVCYITTETYVFLLTVNLRACHIITETYVFLLTVNLVVCMTADFNMDVCHITTETYVFLLTINLCVCYTITETYVFLLTVNLSVCMTRVGSVMTNVCNVVIPMVSTAAVNRNQANYVF